MEFDINDDPLTYEARPIFGQWTRRQSMVGLGVFASVATITGVAWATNLPIDVAGIATFAIGCVAGYFALSRRHGLYPEDWMPILKAEREAPVERVWQPPVMQIEDLQGEPQLSRKESKRERMVRNAELESDDLLSNYLTEDELSFDGDNDAQVS